MKPRGEILNRPVVLLVEDEPLVRLTHVDILREADFWVLEAENADEAFEILKQRPDIKVVLTDVNMPGSLDGFEFARLVRQGWPDVGVMVISGKTASGPGDLPPGTVFAPKPVRPAALVEQIERMIDTAGEQSADEGPSV
jgi:two-component system, response regulator PdtaR